MRLRKSSDSIVHIFTRLCLSQVKEQLNENLVCCTKNPQSFILDGHLFCVINNRSIILDESLLEYNMDTKYNDSLN